MSQVHSFVPLQAARCASSAGAALAQFDAYTKALQALRMGSAELLVPLYMHRTVIPT
jgi:hypothetical protein